MPNGRQYCAATNCINNRRRCPNMSFFRIPKDPDRSDTWLLNARLDKLLKKDVTSRRAWNLCSDHFQQTQFMNQKRNRLVYNAVPTLFNFAPKSPEKSIIVTKRPVPKCRKAPVKNKRVKGAELRKLDLYAKKTYTPAPTPMTAVSSAVTVVTRSQSRRNQDGLGGSTCAAKHCKNRWEPNTNRRFFSFPRSRARCEKWMKNSGREDLRTKTEECLRRSYRICSDHFTRTCFVNAALDSLVRDAVPTLFAVESYQTMDHSSFYERCAAYRCHSLPSGKAFVTWHSFPEDPEIRGEWEKISRGEVTADSILCSKHFPLRDFIGDGPDRILRHNAVPVTSYLQNFAELCAEGPLKLTSNDKEASIMKARSIDVNIPSKSNPSTDVDRDVPNDLEESEIDDPMEGATPEYLLGPDDKHKKFTDKSTTTSLFLVPPPSDHDYLGMPYRETQLALDAANKRIIYLMNCNRQASRRQAHNKTLISELQEDIQSATLLILDLNTKLEMLTGENIYDIHATEQLTSLPSSLY